MLRSILISLCAITVLGTVYGAEPVVKTVPWIASDTAIPHDTFASKSITLKGTSSLQGLNIRATWDFGDGSAPASFNVDNGYDVSTSHVYHGLAGDTYSARLTVTDTMTGDSSSAVYLVAVREKTLQTEANVAIDEGLWYLHRSMNRASIGAIPAGNWNGDCRACDLTGSANAWNVLAFERHGHLESGDSSNPYTETVARGLKTLLITANPDQTWVDALTAANSPNAVAVTGDEGVAGKTYRDLLSKYAGKQQATKDAAASVDADFAKLIALQDPLGYWYGHQTDSSPAVETPQALLSLVAASGLHLAGNNSVLNVSSQVTVTSTGWLLSRVTNTYNGNLTVKNTSASVINGPISVGILNLTAGVILANSNGTFNGVPYVIVTASPLNPGASATIQLRFTNPSNAVISFNRVTYSGTMPPAALTIACPASSATINTPYTSSFDANGGAQIYTYSITGMLPSGLTLNTTTGAVTGAPDTVENPSFTATVTDSAGPTVQTISASCNINVTNGAQPDLTITKTHSGNFTQGSIGNTYTVVVTNSGTGDKTAAQAVSVTDTTPAGLTVTAMSGSGWTCTTLPTCTRNDVLLPAASYPAITVTVSVAADATSPKVNSVTVTTAATESNAGNNTATDSTTIVQPDLTISKSHAGNFAQGSTGNNYTVTVTNSGLGNKLAGQAVSVTDTAPTGLTVTAMSGSGWTCTTLPTCTRSDVLLAAAAYPAITVTVSVAADATSPKVNSITVTTAQSESNSGNNTATDSTIIDTTAEPDLTISKTHTGNFTQGSTGNTYTVVVTNSGSGDKTAGQAVSVTDAPPVGLTVTAMSGSGWTCTSLPTCTRNDVLAAAASYPAITVTVSVASNATSPKVNSVTVTTAQSESNAGNNTATDSTTIVQPDLTITKTHSGSFAQGSTGNTYTVTVTNSGAGDKLAGQSVSVTDAPPTGLTVTAMSGSGWTCTTLPTCTRTDALLPAASYPAITVTVTVGATATSPQVNSISVTTAQSESNAANNTATDSTTIVQADLTISKSHTGNFTQGSTGNTYTVIVTNSGVGDKSAGQSVSVTDAPPVGLTVTAMSGSGWTCTTLPTCTRNDVLAAAASYPAITVTVTVSTTATSPRVNSVSVTTAQGESNAGNNTATDSTIIVQPDLTITKTHTGNFLQGSTGNNYTVTVTNSGAGDKLAGQSVSVTDAPPAGLTVTAMSGSGWTCTTLPTCTRTDLLAPAASYPAITVTVTVASNATSPKVNSITVTTAQTESNAANNTATDSTTIEAPPQITSVNNVTFAPGKTGQSFTVTTTGLPTGASMVITRTGSLPGGVNFTDNNDGTATINGTPAAGTQGVTGTPPSQAYPLTINADNSIPPPASQAFTLTIACPVVTVSNGPASPWQITHNVAASSAAFTQSGGNGTITWSATGLPTNLSIGAGTGVIGGTPNVTGTFNVVVTATDAGGCVDTQALVIAVGPNLPAQSYTGVGNTQFFITGVAGAPTTPAVSSASGLLTGVTPAGGVAVTGASCTGGTIASDAAGLFIFTPDVSAISATCTYTASSNTGPGSVGAVSRTANLSFTLNNKVWYVSHGSAGAHDGRSNSPFLDLGGGANNLNCTSGTANGDYIYVHQGTGNTTGACALKTNQSLIGAGATLTVGPLTVTGNTANTPTITGTLSASSATGLTVNGVSMSTGSSTAVNLSSSGGNLTFKSINTSGAATAISLSSTTGTFNVTGDGTGRANGSGGSLTNSTFSAITALTAAGTIDLKSMNISITINANQGVLVDNIAGGTLAANITGCTFTGVGPGNAAQNKALLQFDVAGTANITPNVQNSFFFNNRSYGLAIVAAGNAVVNATLNQSGFGTEVNTGAAVNNPGTTITNAPPFSLLVSNSANSDVHYNITNNTFWGARGADGAIYAVSISGASSNPGATLNGFFTSNKIGKAGVTGSGCSGNCGGLGLLPGIGGTFNFTLNNNDIRQTNSVAVNLVNSVTAATTTIIGHIKGNTIAEPDLSLIAGNPPAFQRAIAFVPTNSGGAAVTSCLEMGDYTGAVAADKNNISGAWQTGQFVRISNLNNTTAMTVAGLPGGAATAAAVNAFVQAHNTFGAPATGSDVNTTLGPGINGGGACAVTP